MTSPHMVCQDCMELLLPMAAKKLDLSFNIEPDVPPCKQFSHDRNPALSTAQG